MPFIRLSDDYLDNPKFTRLTDGAFRLWHESLAFCRRHSTDGVFDFRTMRGFRYFAKSREQELSTPHVPSANPLWLLLPEMGYQLHDYLDWNKSRAEEAAAREGSATRMRRLRQSRDAVTLPVTNAEHTPRTNAVRAGDGDRNGSGSVSEKRSGEKPSIDVLGERAGRLRQELYPSWYAKYRHGAKLRLMANSLEFQDAMSLVELWDDARLEKLATLVLTTDDPWISQTDRGFRIFAQKASWADERLSEWEAKRRQA